MTRATGSPRFEVTALEVPLPRKQTGPDGSRPTQVLFVQGGGEGTHDSWDDKLVASLRNELGNSHAIRYPRMPDEGSPDPSSWKKAIDRELAQLSGRVILVGHSIGAAIVLDHLADPEVAGRVAGIFLIATPFIGEGGWPSDELRPTRELAKTLAPTLAIQLYQGSADDTVPPAHVDLLAATLPNATVHRLEGRNHQLDDDLAEVARGIRALEER